MRAAGQLAKRIGNAATDGATLVAASYRITKSSGEFGSSDTSDFLGGAKVPWPATLNTTGWGDYVQSNGKLERWHRTLKVTTIRPNTPATLEEARELVAAFVEHYNNVRLHSEIGYITPADKLAGRETSIWADRDRKLEAARELRRQRRADRSLPRVPPGSASFPSGPSTKSRMVRGTARLA